jgi:predicted Zn-dependent peptidase
MITSLRWAPVVALIFLMSCNTKKAGHELKSAESNGYSYEYVPDDPLKVRIYTLKNGLKVYLSQYKNEPRVQTQIAVKAGGKNDPATNTGLAHYLEHIMFKGTSDFGTLDWAKESVLLDSIEGMFNHYGTLKDSMERLNYYKLIDKVSNEASKFAIANEYDKMVSELGARGTNAYTTEDRTVYINDIPSNQLGNWIQIESNRFKKIVPRLFHTELEAVYEEKNGSIDNDYVKANEAMYENVFRKHQYGTQTVIGTIDHLKNPSITEIKKYFDTYYRPNNVAICISGDLDYDQTIASIEKYFGDWQPNETLPVWTKVQEDSITSPVSKEVRGPDAEWVNIGFRFDGRSGDDYNLLTLVDMMLANSQAGLIDINLKQKQKVLEAGCYPDMLNDYAIHTLTGRPREGQSLDEVKDLLLGQIDLIKRGEFEDWLVDAAINHLKKYRIEESEYNWSRSNSMVMAFTNSLPWNKVVGEIESLRQYTKEDLVKFANEHYKDNYVVVYKRTGKDLDARKVNKPAITKVTLNKEDRSAFHKAILANKVDKLQPVFIDFDKDLQKLKMNKDVEVLYTTNQENELFNLYFLSSVGSNNDPKKSVAVEYLQYLGTDDMAADDIKKEFYKLGCNFYVYAAQEKTYIGLNGLNENMEKALVLLEKLLANAKPDEEALKNMIDGMFKTRDDTKKDKWAIMFSGLINYGLYGRTSPFTNVLSNKDLRNVNAGELVDIIKNFTKTEHRVLYYGPEKSEQVVALMNKYHTLPDKLEPAPPPVEFKMIDVTKPNVYWANYDMVQEEIMFLSKGDKFDKGRIPISRMFNEYFGGSMSSPVFQELREAQGLAYSAFAYYGSAYKPTDNDLFYGYIGTQSDKQPEAMSAMHKLLVDFPRSESGFETARNAILNQIESERITKSDILFTYESALERGLNYDIRKDIYDQAQKFTLDDIAAFQQQYIKGKTFNVVLIGDKAKINFKALQPYGKVQEVSLDELFGYEKVQKIQLEAPNQ